MLEVGYRPFEACTDPKCQNSINSRIAKGDESMKTSNIVYLDRMSVNPTCSVCGMPPGYISSLYCEPYSPSSHTGGKDAAGKPVIRYRTIPYYKMLALECAGILVGLHPNGADPGTCRAVLGKEPDQRIGLALADDQGEPLPKYKVSDLGKGSASSSAGLAGANSAKNNVRIVSTGGSSGVGATRSSPQEAAAGSRESRSTQIGLRLSSLRAGQLRPGTSCGEAAKPRCYGGWPMWGWIWRTSVERS